MPRKPASKPDPIAIAEQARAAMVERQRRFDREILTDYARTWKRTLDRLEQLPDQLSRKQWRQLASDIGQDIDSVSKATARKLAVHQARMAELGQATAVDNARRAGMAKPRIRKPGIRDIAGQAQDGRDLRQLLDPLGTQARIMIQRQGYAGKDKRQLADLLRERVGAATQHALTVTQSEGIGAIAGPAGPAGQCTAPGTRRASHCTHTHAASASSNRPRAKKPGTPQTDPSASPN